MHIMVMIPLGGDGELQPDSLANKRPLYRPRVEPLGGKWDLPYHR